MEARSVGAFGSNATELEAHEMQQKLSSLLEPILSELSAALQQQINAKVKAAKKRHHAKKWTDRDIDPYFFIAERLLLRNPGRIAGTEITSSRIENRRQKSSILFETKSVSDWCLQHAQSIIKKKEDALRRKREKARKRDARNEQKRRSSQFYSGGLTPRTPRAIGTKTPRPTSEKLTARSESDEKSEKSESKK